MIRATRILPLLLTIALSVWAQPFPPDAGQRAEIEGKLQELRALLAPLRVSDSLYADVAIYLKAGERALRYPEEFYQEDYVDRTLRTLDEGLERARQLAAGRAPWLRASGRIARAYRSRVDGSLQPYAVVIPEGYDFAKPGRLDVVLHGRNARLNEVRFLTSPPPSIPDVPAPGWLQLEVYGRTNNAYRWAGETDVFEALAAVQEHYPVDPDRIVLRGFSMGGAGTWHIGLHHPGRWAGFEAGAGFNETIRYAKRSNLPPYQEKPLTIYDGFRYAANIFNLPGVGYGGEDDPQVQSSVNVRNQLEEEGHTFTQRGLDRTANDLPLLFLVGPKTGHKFHPAKKIESEQFLQTALEKRVARPKEIRFVTYTTKYNRNHWVRVDGLEQHYQRADVHAVQDGSNIRVTTKNVTGMTLELDAPATVEIDGASLPKVEAGSISFARRDGKWVIDELEGSRKHHGLQGPIDDAFSGPFLCVLPTSAPWSEAGHAATARFSEFRETFAKHLRGDVRRKTDKGVTLNDIADYNLILFGDPGSNGLIAGMLDNLPIRWTREKITIGGKDFDSSKHLPVLIFPNPWNPDRYVVLNTGHTFTARDLEGTNALLYPRYGDWAILPIGGGDPVAAGIFNERWEVADPR